MYISIYHILYKGNLLIETGIKEKTNILINSEIESLLKEKKIQRKKLKEIQESFKDVYPPKEVDTPESYKKFIRKTYPKLFEELETLGPKIFKGQVVMGTFIISPNNFGWYVTNNDGKTLLKDANEALLETMIKPTEKDFSIKQVEIEI